MKWWNKKNLNKLNRVLHRDLGYLFIGLTLIYALSGIALILRHLDINLMYSETKIEAKLSPNISKEEFKNTWEKQSNLPKISKVRTNNTNNYDIMVKGGKGTYNKDTGEIELTIFKTNKLFKFVNEIHYNIGHRFTWLALIYCFILIFFAISGAIIVKGKNGFIKRGVWFTLAGIAIPIIIYFFI